MSLRLAVAYDGSAGAATALRVAASLFPSAQARLLTVPSPVAVSAGTAAPVLPMRSPTAVQQAIDELTAEAQEAARLTAQEGVERARADGLEAEAVSVPPQAPAWAALLDAAGPLGADVLVCGTRGRGAFARAVLGSTASSLLHHAELPLLVVPDGDGRLDGPVIVAYDGSEGAQHAIEVVGRLLRDRTTVVVHAWESEFHRSLSARALSAGPVDDLREIVELLHDSRAEAAEATTQQGVDLARVAGLEAVAETIESDAGPWRTVAAAARKHDAAVIVTGSRGLGRARSALLGSVSSGLVQNAERAVLV
ncbi:MAG TPA: universal stress protein, partial [Solirubrobacteraceae bacterium]|nr:universal stress protein [Solirubrobacteraceae bacterium]